MIKTHKTHKTWTGLVKAVERLIVGLDAATIADDREYREFAVQCDSLLRELTSLWSNPADVSDAAKLANRLRDAWHHATT